MTDCSTIAYLVSLLMTVVVLTWFCGICLTCYLVFGKTKCAEEVVLVVVDEVQGKVSVDAFASL